MEKYSLQLFKVFGIPIRANLSVALLAAYLVFQVGDLLIGGYIAGVLIVSILLHELAHSVVAIAFGGTVRDITLQLLGGCAMMAQMPRKPWQECLMALAGPFTSLLLGWGASWLAMHFAVWHEPYMTPEGWVFECEPNLWILLIGQINFGLGLFNLIPAFPMDGGRVLRSALQIFLKKVMATLIAVRVGQGFAILWFALSIFAVFGMEIPEPEGMGELLTWIWRMVFGGGGMLLFFIACMIWVSGRRELAYVRQEEAWMNGGV